MRYGFSKLKQDGLFPTLFEDSFTMLDTQASKAVHWMPDARYLSERDRAAPLQSALSWWLPKHGHTVMHAAALGREDGALLLFGKGGAGKSRTSLACLQSGFLYLGDDLCAVTEDAEVKSLYCSGKVFEHDLAFFPGQAASIINPDRLVDEKAIAYVTDWQPEAVRRSLPVRALIHLAGRGAPEALVRPLSPARALLALGPSTMFVLPGLGGTEMAGLAALVKKVPAYEMVLSADVEANPRALRELIERRPALSGSGAD
jgi:hypothetical protein